MDKTKGEGGGGGGRWVQLRWGGGMGRKGIQLYLNNNKNFKKVKKLIKKVICSKTKSCSYTFSPLLPERHMTADRGISMKGLSG